MDSEPVNFDFAPMNLLSLGAGVQSSTLALMASLGEIGPMPDAAIFSDTQDEPASVYKWLDWLEKQLPFPVHRVTKGRLSDLATNLRTHRNGRDKWVASAIPMFFRNSDGKAEKLPRQCTREFKIRPIIKKARELAGIKRGERSVRVIQWIGISLDEVSRMRTSRDAWIENRYPLIDREMTRHDCLRWLDAHGFPRPTRSACVYCPYKLNAEWRHLKAEEPEAFERAVAIERQIQQVKEETTDRRKVVPFLHRSCVPLDLADLSSDEDRGQGVLAGFNAECEGMCGV